MTAHTSLAAALVRAEQPWVTSELATIYDTLASDYVEDLTWYQELAALHGRRVLELACGSGRILLMLAQADCRVVGLDMSPPMLAIARTKVAAASPEVANSVQLVESPMQEFALDEQFDLAIIGARSFAYLLTRADQQRTLATVARHLRHGGVLALDLRQPDPAWLQEPPGSLRQDVVHLDADTGQLIARTETVVSTDLAAQVRVLRSGYEIVRADGSVRKHFVEWPYRWTHRFEAELLLEQAGFEQVEVYGGYERQELTASSHWMVLLARRRANAAADGSR